MDLSTIFSEFSVWTNVTTKKRMFAVRIRDHLDIVNLNTHIPQGVTIQQISKAAIGSFIVLEYGMFNVVPCAKFIPNHYPSNQGT